MNTKSLSDSELLNAYFSGNENAISLLIERHKKRVNDYIFMMVKDHDVKDDIFQEAIIKVVRFLDEGRYVENGRFLSWVLRVTHNQVIDYFRKNKQTKLVTEKDAGYDILNSHRFADGAIEDKLITQQIEQDVRKLVEQLPDEQREVVKMRYFQGLSFKEIAELSEVSINTALGRMRYALINLRKMINQNNMILS
ncbi:MAG: sigma-70 family RNA polymerase sigma factor [Rikenellaceae bacterium]